MNEVLFLLYTCRRNRERASACLRTWGKHLQNLIVITDKELSLNCKQEIIASEGYEKLCEKSLLMWEMAAKKYKHRYRYFIKVDDDTLIFPERVCKKLMEQKWEFFGNAKKYFKSEDQGHPWITGCFYGLSRQGLESLMRAVSKKAGRKKFISRGSAEDVSVSVCLAEKGIGASHWDEVLILDSKKKLKEAILNKKIVSVNSLKPWQMKLMSAWMKIQQ